jgi:nicotinamidase-related amidase
MTLMEANKSSLLIVDVQDRLLPAMSEPERLIARSSILLTSAAALGLPVTISEQYPKGLGHTVTALHSNTATVFEKSAFSCWRDAALKAHFIAMHDGGRPQVVIGGIEAHVCVLQTAIDMAQAGFGVFVVADAVSSRKPESAALAFDRMRDAGVQVVNTEMVVFELLGKAGTAEFKALSGLIK